MQSKTHSLIEACLNTASGFIISYIVGLYLFPLMGWKITPTENFLVVSIYTVISVIRSYVWRRAFNHRVKKSRFDLVEHLRRQRAFSQKTFGYGLRSEGICAHIRKELDEIAREPFDLEEWIDVVILGFDGAWRTCHSPEEIVNMLVAKQEKNEARQWPDYRKIARDQPIEHVK